MIMLARGRHWSVDSPAILGASYRLRAAFSDSSCSPWRLSARWLIGRGVAFFLRLRRRD